MTPKTLVLLANDMTFAELECTIAGLSRLAYWQAEDTLYVFESPAYSYWASGFPDGPWSRPEGTAGRDEWERKRAKLQERSNRFNPHIARQTSTQVATLNRRRWPALLVGLIIGELTGGGALWWFLT